MLLDEEPGGDQRQMDALLAQPVTERPEVRVQQRLAAREHDALDVQPRQRRDVPVERVEGNLALLRVGLPDVAHHAAAVTGAVHAERQDGQRLHAAGQAPRRPARDLDRGGQHDGRSRPGSASRSFAARLAIQRASSFGAPSTSTGVLRSVEHRSQIRVAHQGRPADHGQANVRARGQGQRLERVGRERANDADIRRGTRRQPAGVGEAQHTRGPLGDGAEKRLGADLARRVRGAKLVEQIALAAQPRIRSQRQPSGVVELPRIGGAAKQKVVGRGAPDERAAALQDLSRRAGVQGDAVHEHRVLLETPQLTEAFDFGRGIAIDALGGVHDPGPVGRRTMVHLGHPVAIDAQRVAVAELTDDTNGVAGLERAMQRIVMAHGGHARQQVLQPADPEPIVERVRRAPPPARDPTRTSAGSRQSTRGRCRSAHAISGGAMS